MFGILTFFCLALAATVNCASPDLKWPKKYAFEITTIRILSGLVEDSKVWVAKDSARLEFNNGAVKQFFVGKGRYGREAFEIFPVSDGETFNEIQCQRLYRRHYDVPEILPSVDDWVETGEELMKDVKCTKFELDENNEYIESKKTLWAAYDNKLKAWIPVRLETKQFNTWLGYNDVHEIVDFENFQSDFDEKKVFDVNEYCSHYGTDDPIREVKFHDVAVTKHLKFVDPNNKHHVNHVFKAFKKHHNKHYATKSEHEMRKRILQNNMKTIISTNRKNLGYKLAINHLADRTPEERKRATGLLRRSKGQVGTEPFPYDETKLQALATDLPEEYDLRILGIVPPIENQEHCGSCWTFGTTSAVEGALARYNGGKLLKLAKQALVDCAWEFGAAGCDGGSDTAAYQWMMKYGMPTEADYGTYADQDGFCLIQNMTTTYKIRGFVDVTPNSEGALKIALINHGPLSVSVHVTDQFSLYNSGIFYDLNCDPTELNHEITLVGYGSYYGEDFWIVKNSWGQEWGIDGYMHISARDNNCGIMTEPTYVLI